MLRNGVDYSRAISNNIVKTCCILHNMLLSHDGLHEYAWDNDNPDMSDEDIFGHEEEEMDDNAVILGVWQQPLDTIVLNTTPKGRSFDSTNRNDYFAIKSALVTHLHFQWKYRQLQWPKRFRSDVKRLHPLRRIQDIMGPFYEEALYVKSSDLIVVRDPNVSIGQGLFCNVFLPRQPEGIRLCEFKGTIISVLEFQRRTTLGRGGYGIEVEDGILDCYEEAKVNATCKASLANCARGCRDITTGTPAVNNCKIVVNQNKVGLYTIPNTTIPAHRELLWLYQNLNEF